MAVPGTAEQRVSVTISFLQPGTFPREFFPPVPRTATQVVSVSSSTGRLVGFRVPLAGRRKRPDP